MAKGDDSRARNQVQYQTGQSQGTLDPLRNELTSQDQNIYNNYYNSSQQSGQDYNTLMNNYRAFSGLPPSGSQPGNYQQLQTLIGGDYSPANLQKLQPQINALGFNIQNQGYTTDANGNQVRDLRPRFTDTQGNTYDDGDTGWVQRGNSLAGNAMGGYAGSLGNAINSYQNFADTGGFSPQDIQNLRDRATSQQRGIYQDAQSNIDRSKALTGGYSPGYTAATAKLARDQSSAVGDANVNASAALAQLINQGKQFGTTGLANSSLAGGQLNLSALNSMNNLYGTTPGQTNMYGNQLLQGNNQRLGLQGLQQNIGQTAINGQIAAGQLPGKFQSAMGNLGSGLSLASGIANGLGNMGMGTNAGGFNSNGGGSNYNAGYPYGGGPGYAGNGTPDLSGNYYPPVNDLGPVDPSIFGGSSSTFDPNYSPPQGYGVFGPNDPEQGNGYDYADYNY